MWSREDNGNSYYFVQNRQLHFYDKILLKTSVYNCRRVKFDKIFHNWQKFSIITSLTVSPQNPVARYDVPCTYAGKTRESHPNQWSKFCLHPTLQTSSRKNLTAVNFTSIRVKNNKTC